ncbi:MAG: hypothetical protein QXW18_04555 [Candidatus Bathyarchaeia archaeon]
MGIWQSNAAMEMLKKNELDENIIVWFLTLEMANMISDAPTGKS